MPLIRRSLIGAIILLGFAARILFEKTRIPDVLIMMGFGVFLGQFISPGQAITQAHLAAGLLVSRNTTGGEP